MKVQKYLMTALAVLVISVTVTAQVSADSIGSLKQQKQSLQLSNKINDYKMKLAKLENTVEAKTRDVENTSNDAQKSANDNAEAATKLASDPENKQLAKKAENAGDDARKHAKKARVAADDLADLNKEIASLKNKISEDETKLALNPLIVPVVNN